MEDSMKKSDALTRTKCSNVSYIEQDVVVSSPIPNQWARTPDCTILTA
jgi:hypothetical protein